MKKALIALWGAAQGIIGAYWNMLALLFITHPDSSVGTKEWEEDAMFIPIGYVMLAVWLAAMVLSVFKLRKIKPDILVFSIAWAVSTIIFALVGLLT